MRPLLRIIFLAFSLCSMAFAQNAPSGAKPEAVLGVGDIIRISVYQNPDLTLESARISELGEINFPLIGKVNLGGITATAGEQKIAKMLRDGGDRKSVV